MNSTTDRPLLPLSHVHESYGSHFFLAPFFTIHKSGKEKLLIHALYNQKLMRSLSLQETAKSLGDEIPTRSMSYAPSLRHMVLEYSDKVNDDHLAAIVAVCRGTLYVKDYYGQQIEPKWIFR